MAEFSKQLSQIARSEMSRKALSHWPMFAPPQPNEHIDKLLAKLARSQDGREGNSEHSHDCNGTKR